MPLTPCLDSADILGGDAESQDGGRMALTAGSESGNLQSETSLLNPRHGA